MKFRTSGWTVAVLQTLFDMEKLDNLHESLRLLHKDSTGKAVANLLDERNFRLIPKFQNHDLKHVVLDYEMVLEDEIKMQAYLVGNGNFSWPCILFLLLGIFKPKIWPDLPIHYEQGKNSPSIFELDLQNVMHIPLWEVKMNFGRKKLLPTNA